MSSRIGAITLIVVGVIFLLSNLNVLPFYQVKALLKDWWPVALIVAGILQLKK